MRVARAYLHAKRSRRRGNPFSERIIFTGPVNGSAMQETFVSLQPDFIVLAGIGLLTPQLIETARLGVINVHPGLLPWVRGCGVVGRAVLDGIPVGATAHYVDAGIDTGRIVERRLLPLSGREDSLAELESRADILAIQLLVDVVAQTLASGQVPESRAQTTKYRLCHWLSRDERIAVDELIRSGQAKACFDRWSQWAVDRNSCRLPADFESPK